MATVVKAVPQPVLPRMAPREDLKILFESRKFNLIWPRNI